MSVESKACVVVRRGCSAFKFSIDIYRYNRHKFRR